MTNQQRKFYRAILSTFCEYFYPAMPEDIHAELKCGYKLKSTTSLDKQGWIDFLDYAVQMFAEAHNIYFNSDYYNHEGIKRVILK